MIRSFADFNLEDILIPDDAPDEAANTDDVTYENDFEEESCSPMSKSHYAKSVLQSSGNYYEDDFEKSHLQSPAMERESAPQLTRYIEPNEQVAHSPRSSERRIAEKEVHHSPDSMVETISFPLQYSPSEQAISVVAPSSAESVSKPPPVQLTATHDLSKDRLGAQPKYSQSDEGSRDTSLDNNRRNSKMQSTVVPLTPPAAAVSTSSDVSPVVSRASASPPVPKLVTSGTVVGGRNHSRATPLKSQVMTLGSVGEWDVAKTQSTSTYPTQSTSRNRTYPVTPSPTQPPSIAIAPSITSVPSVANPAVNAVHTSTPAVTGDMQQCQILMIQSMTALLQEQRQQQQCQPQIPPHMYYPPPPYGHYPLYPPHDTEGHTNRSRRGHRSSENRKENERNNRVLRDFGDMNSFNDTRHRSVRKEAQSIGRRQSDHQAHRSSPCSTDTATSNKRTPSSDPVLDDMSEDIYANFLSDLIELCKSNVDKLSENIPNSTTRRVQSTAMHKVLADRVYSTFGAHGAVNSIRREMMQAARACSDSGDSVATPAVDSPSHQWDGYDT